MYKRIVLAADGSENALRAAKEACRIASCTVDSEVEIIFVVDYSKSKLDILHSQGKEALDLARRKKLAPIEELFRLENVQYNVKILHGEPGPSIIEYVNSGVYELVVIGSRGLNSLQEMVLGSVSHKVVKRVNCPVLIVK